MRQETLGRTLVAALVAGGVCLPWLSAAAGGLPATPGSLALLEATARWRYTPVSQADLALVQQREAELELHRHAYQRAWQVYVMQLHRCRAWVTGNCVSGPQQAPCLDRALLHCLGPAITELAAARGALHDQAIALEQAAQRLAGETE